MTQIEGLPRDEPARSFLHLSFMWVFFLTEGGFFLETDLFLTSALLS